MSDSESENDNEPDLKLEPIDLFKIKQEPTEPTFEDQVDGVLSKIKTVIANRDKRPILLYVDGEPGAGTTAVAGALAIRLNQRMEDGWHRGPEGYVDLFRMVQNHKQIQEAALFSKLPSACNHPFYSDPSYYIGWNILELLEFYKRRDRETLPIANVTVCDTSPFCLIESLIPDAKKKGYLVSEQTRLIQAQIWAQLTWLTTHYRVFRVFVNRPFPLNVADRVSKERVGGYTDEMIPAAENGGWSRKFAGIGKLEYKAIIPYCNDEELGDLEEIVRTINVCSELNI